MHRHQRLWDVETATAWLMQCEWGEDVVKLLHVDSGAERPDQWLGMVAAMHSAMYCPGNPIFDRTESVASWNVERAAQWLRRFPFGERLLVMFVIAHVPAKSGISL